MSQSATIQSESALHLELYTVMSPWHPDDSEQGTYEASVWAASHEQAERELAALMADSSDGCPEGEDIEQWIEEHLEACRHLMVTTRAIDAIQTTLLELLSGPAGGATPEVKADLTTIMSMLTKHSAARTVQPSVADLSPCACWPGRLCDRHSTCAAEIKATGG